MTGSATAVPAGDQEPRSATPQAVRPWPSRRESAWPIGRSTLWQVFLASTPQSAVERPMGSQRRGESETLRMPLGIATAGEKKELAQETARATRDIAGRVEAIQSDSRAAADAMARVSEIIASIDGYNMTIASAAEEQTATTTEMSRNVIEAAGGSGQIAENIVGVAGKRAPR